MMTGSLKLISAIFQALFIGFVQTLGSDIWLKMDSSARAERLKMMAEITSPVFSSGSLMGNWTTHSTSESIALSVAHILDPNAVYPEYNFVGVGCYRGPDWPWYVQGLKWQWTIPLVPLFALLLAVWNLQRMQNWPDAKHVLIMVLFGCAAYAGKLLLCVLFSLADCQCFFPLSPANTAGTAFVHGSVGSILGAFVVSLFGSLYSQLWHGYAFAVMIPGILLLVPSGLTAAGGLAQNYGGTDDQFSSGLSTGLAMIECACPVLAFLSTEGHTSDQPFCIQEVSIALTIGICLGAAGFHFFQITKHKATQGREAVIHAFSF